MSELILRVYPPGKHKCDKPGGWRRRSNKLGIGSIIKCSCGTYYIFCHHSYIDEDIYQWEVISKEKVEEIVGDEYELDTNR